VRPNDVDKVPITTQSWYMSGVGMLFYFMKHSRPDLANVFRELSKCMGDESIAAYKEMIRVLRFVLVTRNTRLKSKPNLIDENWDLVV
jgi:hypothetical protein